MKKSVAVLAAVGVLTAGLLPSGIANLSASIMMPERTQDRSDEGKHPKENMKDALEKMREEMKQRNEERKGEKEDKDDRGCQKDMTSSGSLLSKPCNDKEKQGSKLANRMGLFELRWGTLGNADKACLEDNATTCTATERSMSGSFTVDNGTLSLEKTLRFEKNDTATLSQDSKSISFSTTVKGGMDGALVKFQPAIANGQVTDAKPTFTLVINGTTQTFSTPADFKKIDLGDGYSFDVRPGFVPMARMEKQQDDFMNNKMDMNDRLEKAREKVGSGALLQKLEDKQLQKFDQLRDHIEQYNFHGQGAVKMKALLDEFMQNLSPEKAAEFQKKLDELQGQFEKVKMENRAEKYQAGLLPFKDIDDNEWFSDYIQFVKEKNIVSGFKDKAGKDMGEFRAGNNVTVAELLKMVLEASKKGQKEGTPVLQSALQHWSKGYVMEAESLGMALVKNLDNLDRPATRAEVIKAALQAFGIVPTTATTSSFADVDMTKNADTVDYIEYAKAKGIISGDTGTNNFRPNAAINRAEVAKILKGLMELQ